MTSAPGPSPDRPVIRVLVVLLRRRRAFLASVLAVGLLVVVVTLLTVRPSYTSAASFIPQGARAGGLSALADQFGIAVPGDASSESPAFYAELLRSREILGRLLQDTFSIGGGIGEDGPVRTAALPDLLGIEGGTPQERHEAGLRRLGSAVSVDVSRETSVVRVRVSSPRAELSRQLNERLLALVNDFNLRTRQSQASAERTFIERRLEEARAELTAAEEQLEGFLEDNRQFRNSPELLFQHDRLERQVALRQQVLVSLSQSYEESRIAEARDTPLITVVEPPHEPVQPDASGLVARGALTLLLAMGVGLGVVLALEGTAGRSHAGRPDLEALRSAWRDDPGAGPGMEDRP